MASTAPNEFQLDEHVGLPERAQRTARGRQYRGLSAADRQAERREKLIESGTELFGTVGVGKTSIRAVLRHSGVGERYFRESFDSIDDLLATVQARIHERVVVKTFEAVQAAGDDYHTRIHVGLTTFLDALTSDPRWLRIKVHEIAGPTGGIQELGGPNSMLGTFASFLASEGPAEAALARGLNPYALGLACAAGIQRVMLSWAIGELEMTYEELHLHCSTVLDSMVLELER